MREIGNRFQDRVGLAGQGVDLGGQRGGGFAQLATVLLELIALGGVFGLADRLAHVVGVAVGFFQLRLFGLALGFEGDEPIDVGRGVALPAVLSHQFRVFQYEAAVEHGRSRFACWASLGTCFGQLFPQIRAGFDAALEVGQRELFVGAVRVVVVQPPTQQ